jgi:hypothetical protein
MKHYSMKVYSGTYWIGEWVVPRTGLDDVEREKSYPYWDLNSTPRLSSL